MRRFIWMTAGSLALSLVATAPLCAQLTPQLDTELARLPALGRIVYVTAHPDDESGPVITYLARGLHARVVILCMTRGEGGQNQVGPELGEELGEVRTRELEQAAAGYGVEVRFIGAEDFGYSKSVEETLKVWDEKKVLGELVRQIRALRPLAVVTRWSGLEADVGGAHHQAAGMLAREAFAAAGDPAAFIEQFDQGYAPWQPRYLLVQVSAREEGRAVFPVPAGQPSGIGDKSFEQIGWEAFRSHRSQGMHQIDVSRFRGRDYFLRVEATLKQGPAPPESVTALVPDLGTLPDLFPSVEFLGAWRERLAQASGLALEAHRLAADGKPSEAALALVQGGGLLAALRREIPPEGTEREANSVRILVAERQNDFLSAAAALAGIELQAYTDRAAVTPGEQAWVGLAVRVGAPEVFQAAGFKFGALQLDTPADWGVEPLVAESTPEGQRKEFLVKVPTKPNLRLMTEPALGARATLGTGSLEVNLRTEVKGLSSPTGAGTRRGLLDRLQQLDPRRLLGRAPSAENETNAHLEPVREAPAVTLSLEPRLRLVAASPGELTREWCVQLEAHRPQIGKISVWFDVPVGWYTPLPQETQLEAAVQRVTQCLSLTLPGHIPAGRYELKAQAGRGTETYELARRIRFAGTSGATYSYSPAIATVDILDVQAPAGLRIGYIGFDDDPLPKLLADLGVAVDLLDERALATARLAIYDTVVISNRAYDYRTDLTDATPRLLDYVKAGGALVVEHQGRGWDPAKMAPYPGTKSNRNLRVTDETAAVKVLAPMHRVMTFPNVISDDDWKGWVQERGLYFWESWAESYEPLLEMADPGEAPQRGALLYARYREGVFIYSGLALFRQVRAGVPGGVRLYINLLSQGRALKAAAAQRPRSRTKETRPCRRFARTSSPASGSSSPPSGRAARTNSSRRGTCASNCRPTFPPALSVRATKR